MAAKSAITDVLQYFQDSGARPNRFKVTLTGSPTGVSFGEAFTFLCRSASIPSSTIGRADVAFMGRTLKLNGDKEFDDWNVTIYNSGTTAYEIRKKFETWMNNMLKNVDNITEFLQPNSYFAGATVEHLDRKGETMRFYQMQDIFPTSVGAMELAWDSNNTVQTFDVTFAVNWWESDF